MSSQRQRRSTSPRGNKAAGPAAVGPAAAGPAVGYETPEGIEQASNDIYATPKVLTKRQIKRNAVRALQTMMSNFKKDTITITSVISRGESWNLVLPLQLLQNPDSFLVFKVTQNQKLHLV